MVAIFLFKIIKKLSSEGLPIDNNLSTPSSPIGVGSRISHLDDNLNTKIPQTNNLSKVEI